MQIHEPSLQRVRDAQVRGEAIATIFEHMAMMTSQLGHSTSEFVLGYQKPEDSVQEGDLVPVITLALRPAFRREQA